MKQILLCFERSKYKTDCHNPRSLYNLQRTYDIPKSIEI